MYFYVVVTKFGQNWCCFVLYCLYLRFGVWCLCFVGQIDLYCSFVVIAFLVHCHWKLHLPFLVPFILLMEIGVATSQNGNLIFLEIWLPTVLYIVSFLTSLVLFYIRSNGFFVNGHNFYILYGLSSIPIITIPISRNGDKNPKEFAMTYMNFCQCDQAYVLVLYISLFKFRNWKVIVTEDTLGPWTKIMYIYICTKTPLLSKTKFF
jgi:hypothetical protein